MPSRLTVVGVVLSSCILGWMADTALLAQSTTLTPALSIDGTSSEWHGFRSIEFNVDGKPVTVVMPDHAVPGRPWVWHGEFFGHRPQPDIELLKRGFYLVYMRIPDLLGAPQAVAHWDQLYTQLTQKHGFALRPALVGISRGGLYCYNWAAANPDQVACIYGDAPVCDLKSWPGGKGQGVGSRENWELAFRVYGFDDEAAAMRYQGNPVDSLQSLAQRGVPLLHVYGDADEVVPWRENTGLLAERYRELGGSIELIAKPGVGHHPHGLDDSTPIVEFIEKNSLRQFTAADTPLRIACVGDSITAGARVAAEFESYPARLQQMLGASFEIRNFGVGGATLLKSGRPNVWRQLDAIREFQPQCIVLSLGTNDTVSGKRMNWEHIDQFEPDARDLIAELARIPSAPQIVFCTPTDMVLNTPGLKAERLAELTARRPRLLDLCQRIRRLVADDTSGRVSLLELQPLLADQPQWISIADGVHPNRAGYTQIASAVAKHLRSLFSVEAVHSPVATPEVAPALR